ncbi:metallophosphoesterase [Spirosoma endbachense]|uniref:Metallophosphoesterase n=1 Tax=Spirosoma endbachense TaxID=2666025 RepID=A0A6P1VXD2_9BACT|nr:metallophosphoesterase [Spirosoma endbachense]QHV96359.1 hypothetical protein GJR95_15615 [Spirosoma endbachense]
MKQSLPLFQLVKISVLVVYLTAGIQSISEGRLHIPNDGEALVRGPYLQKASPTSMTFRWRTDPASIGVVRFGASASSLSGSVSETTAVIDHEVTITGLTPNTQYYYSVGTPTGSLQGDAANYFYTFPPEGTPKKTRIWSLGDFGYLNSARQANVKNAFKNYMKSIGDPYIDLWLWLGDNAYNQGLDNEYQAYVFSSDVGYGGDRYMKQTPIFSTPGNHDYVTNELRVNLNIPYYGVVSHPTNAEAGGVPSGTESYYSFNYGNIHFVSLDSDRYEDNADVASDVRFLESRPQLTWLKQDLAAAQANPNIKWIIAFWHHPPYTKGTHDSDTNKQLRDVRMNLLPVLEQYKVDLVMCGHSHVYERSRLMKGHYGDALTYDSKLHNSVDGSNAKSSGKFDGSSNSCYYFKSRNSATNEGTVYVVNGHGGAPGGRILSGTAQWPHNAMEVAYDDAGGSMYLEIEGGKLVSKLIAGDGSIQDQFTIIKDGDGFSVPATNGIARNATCECTDGNNQTHYTDAELNKILSISKNGQNIGRIGDGTFSLQLKGTSGASVIAPNSPTNYVTLPTGWSAANRYYTLKPTNEPSAGNPVAVSFYYTQADVDAINGKLGQVLTPQQLKVFTINDGPTTFNPDPASGHTAIPKASSPGGSGASIFTYGAKPSITGWANSGNGGSFRADFLAARLGSGGIGGALNGADPTANPVSVTLVASPAVSPGLTNLSAKVSGGTAPFSYTFSGPGVSPTAGNTARVTSLTAGVQVFSVIVTDAVSQTATAATSVTVTGGAADCGNYFVGVGAGYANTTGCGNVALGPNAGYSNMTGNQSTFVGSWAGFFSSGQANTFVGYKVGLNTTTGNFNTFLGTLAGLNNTIGSANVFLGDSAGSANAAGNYNVYLGTNAGNGAGVNGSNNVSIGSESGRSNQNGLNNTFLGYRANAGKAGLSNATAIGNNARVDISNAIVLGNGANVGIGTGSPGNKLEIHADSSGQSGLRLTQVTSAMTPIGSASKFLTVNAKGDVYLANYVSGGRAAASSDDGLWQRNGRFLQSVKGEAIIIGQGVSKTPSDYNLFVSKGILTEKVKVAIKNTSDWSDHVLGNTYQLRPLAEVERYIQQHQHLPGIPSAEEVVKDGMDVGQMNAKLLEKIEELTLYIIELKKEVNSLRQTVKPTKKR